MITYQPPRPALGGSVGSGTRSAAGYKFCGRDVWRIEVQGNLPSASGTTLVLYKSTVPFAPIAVRGWVTPTAVNNYQRPVTCCSQTTNGGYAVIVKCTAIGATQAQLIALQLTDATRAPGFQSAAFRLQIDFIEAPATGF